MVVLFWRPIPLADVVDVDVDVDVDVTADVDAVEVVDEESVAAEIAAAALHASDRRSTSPQIHPTGQFVGSKQLVTENKSIFVKRQANENSRNSHTCTKVLTASMDVSSHK